MNLYTEYLITSNKTHNGFSPLFIPEFMDEDEEDYLKNINFYKIPYRISIKADSDKFPPVYQHLNRNGRHYYTRIKYLGNSRHTVRKGNYISQTICCSRELLNPLNLFFGSERDSIWFDEIPYAEDDDLGVHPNKRKEEDIEEIVRHNDEIEVTEEALKSVFSDFLANIDVNKLAALLSVIDQRRYLKDVVFLEDFTDKLPYWFILIDFLFPNHTINYSSYQGNIKRAARIFRFIGLYQGDYTTVEISKHGLLISAEEGEVSELYLKIAQNIFKDRDYCGIMMLHEILSDKRSEEKGLVFAYERCEVRSQFNKASREQIKRRFNEYFTHIPVKDMCEKLGELEYGKLIVLRKNQLFIDGIIGYKKVEHLFPPGYNYSFLEEIEIDYEDRFKDILYTTSIENHPINDYRNYVINQVFDSWLDAKIGESARDALGALRNVKNNIPANHEIGGVLKYHHQVADIGRIDEIVRESHCIKDKTYFRIYFLILRKRKEQMGYANSNLTIIIEGIDDHDADHVEMLGFGNEEISALRYARHLTDSGDVREGGKMDHAVVLRVVQILIDLSRLELLRDVILQYDLDFDKAGDIIQVLDKDDLNNQLAVIQGFINAMNVEMSEGSDAYREFIGDFRKLVRSSNLEVDVKGVDALFDYLYDFLRTQKVKFYAQQLVYDLCSDLEIPSQWRRLKERMIL